MLDVVVEILLLGLSVLKRVLVRISQHIAVDAIKCLGFWLCPLCRQ